MLDAYIIHEIKKREEERRRREDASRPHLTVPDPPRHPRPELDDGNERIIEIHHEDDEEDESEGVRMPHVVNIDL